jgi:hypothetical protein
MDKRMANVHETTLNVVFKTFEPQANHYLRLLLLVVMFSPRSALVGFDSKNEKTD